MSGEALTERLIDAIQDDDFGEDFIIPSLNRGLNMISEGVLLPGLVTEADVDTVLNQNFTALPPDYQRNLFRCKGYLDKIEIYESEAQLLRRNPASRAGVVQAVAPLSGTVLVYADIPNEIDTLTIKYNRIPNEVKSDSSVIDGLTPAIYYKSEEAMYHFTMRDMFSLIEDDIQGDKVNTLYHDGEFNKIMKEIKAVLRESVPKMPPPVARGCWK